MKKILLIVLSQLIMLALHSQDARFIEELCQSVIENQEDVDVEALTSQLEHLFSNPLNLNTDNEDELRESLLFTSYQVYGIIKFREKYGDFLSIYELASLPGFNQDYLIQIESLITTESTDISSGRKRSKGIMLLNSAIKLPRSHIYLQPDTLPDSYSGNSIKEQVRFKYQFTKGIKTGMAWEKDPGERIFTMKRPEHLTAYIEYNSTDKLDQLIFGNFRVQQGMGIAQGMGMQTGQPASRLQGMSRSHARPYASCMEYSYYRGVYTKVRLGSWSYNGFISLIPVDISLFNPSDNKSLFERIRKTGLHRTKNEINGISLAKNLSSMLGINYEAADWNTGISFHNSYIKLTRTGRDSVPWMDTLQNSKSNISVYGLYFTNRYEVYGEIAIDQNLHTGIFTGGRMLLSPALSIHISARRYAPGFLSQQATSYSAGSDPDNETGISISADIIPVRHSLLRIWTDIYRDILLPTVSAAGHIHTKYSCSLSMNPSRKLDAEIRYQLKYPETNLLFSVIENHVTKQSFRIHLNYKLRDNLVFTGRSEFNLIKEQAGRLYYQEIKYNCEFLSIKYRYLLFNTPSYETRIYCYEPGVLYSFKFPAFQGKGSRNLLVISTDLGSTLSFRTCIGYTTYFHKHETGTGLDARSGNKAFDFELQLQIDL